MPDFRDVDPRELRVPSSRQQGADPFKLHRQIALFGASAVGMPPPWVYEGTDGVLVLYNGVTRATRIAKLAPGTLIRDRGDQDWRSAAMTEMQREALAVLGEVWTLAPEVRFGQVMTHLGFLGEAHLNKGLGYLDDDELIAIMYRHRAELHARLQGQPLPNGTASSVSGN